MVLEAEDPLEAHGGVVGHHVDPVLWPRRAVIVAGIQPSQGASEEGRRAEGGGGQNQRQGGGGGKAWRRWERQRRHENQTYRDERRHIMVQTRNTEKSCPPHRWNKHQSCMECGGSGWRGQSSKQLVLPNKRGSQEASLHFHSSYRNFTTCSTQKYTRRLLVTGWNNFRT